MKDDVSLYFKDNKPYIGLIGSLKNLKVIDYIDYVIISKSILQIKKLKKY